MKKPGYEFLIMTRKNSRGEERTQQSYVEAIPREYHPIIEKARAAHTAAVRNSVLRTVETFVCIS